MCMHGKKLPGFELKMTYKYCIETTELYPGQLYIRYTSEKDSFGLEFELMYILYTQEYIIHTV